jgi:hypothetical protein
MQARTFDRLRKNKEREYGVHQGSKERFGLAMHRSNGVPLREDGSLEPFCRLRVMLGILAGGDLT